VTVESLSFCLRKLSNESSAVSQMSLPKTAVNFEIEDQWMSRDRAPPWTVFFFATSNDGQFWHVFGDIACMTLRTACQMKALPGSKQLATPKMRLTDGRGRRTRSQRKGHRSCARRALIIAGFFPWQFSFPQPIQAASTKTQGLVLCSHRAAWWLQ
jgi:hypothetical protein